MRTLSISINDLLDLVANSITYGYGDDVFLDGMASWCGREIQDSEIDEYILGLAKEQNAPIAEFDDTKKFLYEWKNTYCC